MRVLDEVPESKLTLFFLLNAIMINVTGRRLFSASRA